MKLKNIYKDLKKAYEGTKTKYIMGLEFGKENDTERMMNVFNKGYWSTVPFAFDSNSIFSIRLMPEYNPSKMPILELDELNCARTIAPNLKSFVPLLLLQKLSSKRLISYAKSDINELEKLILFYQDYTEGTDTLSFYKEFLFEVENQHYFENPKKFFQKMYLAFWDYYNNTPQQKETIILFKTMENNIHLPNFEVKDYGIWNTRVYNALGQRVYFDRSISFSESLPYLWQNFIQPHGIDATDVNFDILPSRSSNFHHKFESIVNKMDTNPDLKRHFPSDIQKHPLFHATQALMDNYENYIGAEHVLAAAVLEEEYNDPIMAFNALISAGYWTGTNAGIALIPAWEATIYLAEKQGWIDIYEVLKSQLDFYTKNIK